MNLVGIKVRNFSEEGVIIHQDATKITVQFANRTVKFIYIGRDSAFSKGFIAVDNPELMEAIRRASEEKEAEEIEEFKKPVIEYLEAKKEAAQQEARRVANEKWRREHTQSPEELEREKKHKFLYDYYKQYELSSDEKKMIEFTPFNLALLGILDDIYDAYNQIIELYKNSIANYKDLELEGYYNDMSKAWVRAYHEYGKEAIEISTRSFHAKPWTLDRAVPNLSFSLECWRWIGLDVNFHSRSYNFAKVATFPEFLHQMEEQIFIEVKRYLRDLCSNDPHSTDDTYYLTHKLINDRLLKAIKAALAECQLPASSVVSWEPLYIFTYLSHTRCRRLGHPVEPRGVVAKLLRENGCINLPTHYCPICKKHFIGSQTLNLYEKNFGPIILDKRKEAELEDGFGGFKVESRLHQLGYNVVDGQLSDSERHRILETVLNNGELTYFQITSIIEQNIQLFKTQKSHQLAVMKWQKDLRFVGDYVLRTADNKD